MHNLKQSIKKRIKIPTSLFLILAIIISAAVTYLLRVSYINSRNLDEGIYLSVANLFSKGFIIYKDIPAVKPPLLTIINAIIVLFIGNDLMSISYLMMIISILCAIIVYYIVLTITNNFKTAIFGCSLFSIFSSLALSEMFWIMTEPYMVFFMLLSIYCLIKAIKSNREYLFIATGFFAVCAPLVRQTAALFIIIYGIMLTHCLYNKSISGGQMFKIILGGILPIIIISGFFAYYNALTEMFRCILINAPLDVLSAAKTGKKTSLWYIEYLASSLPLWLLSSFALLKRKPSYNKLSNELISFLFVWVLVVVGFYRFLSLGPGFHHEYSETIAPLSILASIGTYNIFHTIKYNNYYKIVRTHDKLFSIMFVIVLLFIPISVSYTYNMERGEVKSDDYVIINSISQYLREKVQSSERLFVFETKWPKIGPLIYFESDILPASIKRVVLFPDRITNNEKDLIITSLEDRRVKYAVIIGGEPPGGYKFDNARDIYNLIVRNHMLVYDLGLYTPYPDRIENVSVGIFERFNKKSLDTYFKLDCQLFKGMPITIIENDTMIINYKLQDKEQTLYYQFEENQSLLNKLLSMNVYNENKTQIYIYLVDYNGNSARHEILFSRGWDNITIPINNISFYSKPHERADLNNVKKLCINIPYKEVNIKSSKSMITFNEQCILIEEQKI